MDLVLLTVIGIVVVALLFDYPNGFHDSANSISTIVATRVLRPRLAVLWVAFFNFIAFAFFGTKVANTVGQTVKPGFASVAVIFAALLGAIPWNYLTWWLRLWVVLAAHTAIALGTISGVGGSRTPWASGSPSCGRPGDGRRDRRRCRPVRLDRAGGAGVDHPYGGLGGHHPGGCPGRRRGVRPHPAGQPPAGRGHPCPPGSGPGCRLVDRAAADRAQPAL
jgi:hypothetical protein